MKLLIVRHADPDYSIDSLTAKGFVEARLLADRLSRLSIKAFYVSPLGRAKETAKKTLERMNRVAEECDWLREFEGRVVRPDVNREIICWDWLPQDWCKEPLYYDVHEWMNTDAMKQFGVGKRYQYVTSQLDNLLSRHGYRRTGMFYQVEHANCDTIVLFCHFGVECVLLSHLLGISPMPLWHGFCAAPSSVTTIVTEERRKGIASFRVSSFGDVSHLFAAGEPAAFAARFCECYDNEEERHD